MFILRNRILFFGDSGLSNPTLSTLTQAVGRRKEKVEENWKGERRIRKMVRGLKVIRKERRVNAMERERERGGGRYEFLALSSLLSFTIPPISSFISILPPYPPARSYSLLYSLSLGSWKSFMITELPEITWCYFSPSRKDYISYCIFTQFN